jgi:hypothetical protein
MIHILYAADVANSTTAPEFGSSPTIRVALFGAQAERHGWENSGNGAERKSAIAQAPPLLVRQKLDNVSNGNDRIEHWTGNARAFVYASPHPWFFAGRLARAREGEC